MMTSDKETALAIVMKDDPLYFNARIAEARRIQSGFDTSALSAWLTGPLSDLTEIVSEHRAERVTSFVTAAMESVLLLVSHGLTVGQAGVAYKTLWHTVLPQCIHLLVQSPTEVLGVLHNAVLNMYDIPEIRFDQWLFLMGEQCGSATTLADLRGLAAVLAWRCGLAQYREGALRTARTLPDSLASAALGAFDTAHVPTILSRLETDRWFNPAVETPIMTEVQVMHRVGSFTGFGGNFSRPPIVRCGSDGFVVKSDDRYFRLYVDVFGAVLQPCSEGEYQKGRAGKQGRVRIKKILSTAEAAGMDIEVPVEDREIICTDDTAAVFSPWSHSIYVYALHSGQTE